MRPEPSSTVWEYPASSRAWETSPAGSAAGWPWRRCWPACDVLILDEPTNHLDNDMVLWLEDYLRAWKGRWSW